VTVAPPAATSLAAAPTADTAGHPTVTLHWSAAHGATRYEILRSPDGVTWTSLGSTADTSFTDADVAPNATYDYVVIASNVGGTAVGSDPATITLAPPPASALAATPATDTAGNATVALQWAASPGATGYQVLRSADGLTWTSLGATADTSFTDSSPPLGVTSTYAVIASNTAASAAPATITATIAPPAPSALRAVATSKSSVSLTWAAPPAALRASFTVQTSTDGVAWTNLIVTRRGVTAFTVTGLTRATGYWYRVCTNGQSVSSPFSAVATARTFRYDPPGTPKAFTALTTSATSIQLSWISTGGDVTGFVLERSTDGRHWTTLITLGSATRSFLNTRLTKGVRYYYRLHSFGPAGVSLAPVASTIAATPARRRA
jgi:fibronectin type 3 domain-containing protein